jgi:hypothetical protein
VATKSKGQGKNPKSSEVQQASFSTRIAPAWRHLVDGNIINLSGASEFYKKKAATAEVLQDFVEPLRDSHYRLKNKFDSYFLTDLPIFPVAGLCQA